MNEFVFMLLLVIVYLLPAIVAAKRKLESSNSIFLINLLFGWTIFAWVFTLIWAFGETGKTRAEEPLTTEELKALIPELERKLNPMQQKDEA